MRNEFKNFSLLSVLGCSVAILSGCNGEPSMDTAKLPPPVNVQLATTTVDNSQAAASNALGRIGEPAVEALIQSLADPDPAVRLQTCHALAYMGLQARNAVPALTHALGDPEEGIRQAAAAALGQIGAPAAPAIPALMQMLRGGQGTRSPGA
jgi:HEAT repeats